MKNFDHSELLSDLHTLENIVVIPCQISQEELLVYLLSFFENMEGLGVAEIFDFLHFFLK